MQELGTSNALTDESSFDGRESLLINHHAERVGQVIDFFNQEFGVQIGGDGELLEEPSADQLDDLRIWHEGSSDHGVIMPDFDSFTAKVVLARALMPQRDDNGKILYLFGKGVGLELALQGSVIGRDKKAQTLPYRSHSDFEIYGVKTDSYSEIPNSSRFLSVFGGQEIYPAEKTKQLSNLPPDYLANTSEIVNFGGLEFLVPKLELQLVDKIGKKVEEENERRMRGKTDAEWLAQTYSIDSELVHTIIDEYVIAPKRASFKPPQSVAERNVDLLASRFEQRKSQIKEEMPRATDEQLTITTSNDYILQQFVRKFGVSDLRNLINPSTGQLVDDALDLLIEAETQRQSNLLTLLRSRHQKADEVLQET